MRNIFYNLVEMPTFGNWLLEHRKGAHLTQSQVAERSGVSISYISTLERDQKHSTTGAPLRPEPDKVKRLARALGADEDDALLAAGYAPTQTIGPPQNRKELLEALERIGVAHIEFHDEIDDATPAQLQELFDAVEFAVKLTLSKQGKK